VKGGGQEGQETAVLEESGREGGGRGDGQKE
jgi:hypothetical protein